MKKYLAALFVFCLAGCQQQTYYERDFGSRREELNSWAHSRTFDDLCAALIKYKSDRQVVDGLLREFTRRNISYLDCRQYRR